MKANAECEMRGPPLLGSHWGLSDSRKCWSHKRRPGASGMRPGSGSNRSTKTFASLFCEYSNLQFVLNKDQAKGWKTQMYQSIFLKFIDQSEDRVMTSTSQVFKDWVMDCKVQICILHNSITVMYHVEVRFYIGCFCNLHQ